MVTEDSSEQAIPTVQALARHILELVSGVPPGDRVKFEPLQDQEASYAARANLWKSTKNEGDHKKRVALVREIATTLLQEREFVLWHIDADCTWKGSDSGEQVENVEKFRKLIQDPVQVIVEGMIPAPEQPLEGAPPDGEPGVIVEGMIPAPEQARRRKGRRRSSRSGAPEDGVPASGPSGGSAEVMEKMEKVMEKMEKLILLVPHYSIESWLYQNTAEAIRICKKKDRGRHTKVFESWEKDRASLDEMKQPKKKSGTCLGNRWNQCLAEKRFPAKAVYDTGKSFARAVEQVRACVPLMEALTSPSRAPHGAG